MDLTLDDLKDFVRGAAFLGTGGGGDPYVGRLLVQQEMEKQSRIRIVDAGQLAHDDLVIPVAVMGAPTVMIERFPRVDSLVCAVRQTERRLGKKAAAVMPIEVGGINSTLPLVIAARTGLPVVDADGMGRAFPELQMVTFSIHQRPASPVVLTDDREDTVIVETADNRRAEKLARHVVVSMGGTAHIALYPMSASEVKRTGVLNTLSLALEIGRAIGRARRNKVEPLQGLLEYFRTAPDPRACRVLHRGKITDLTRTTRAGFSVGRATMAGVPGETGTFVVEFQNENLIARRDGRMVAIVPDLICILDDETAEPITTESLRYGQRVSVVGVSVPPIMRSPEALRTFGPSAFGFTEPYIALEELSENV